MLKKFILKLLNDPYPGSYEEKHKDTIKHGDRKDFDLDLDEFYKESYDGQISRENEKR